MYHLCIIHVSFMYHSCIINVSYSSYTHRRRRSRSRSSSTSSTASSSSSSSESAESGNDTETDAELARRRSRHSKRSRSTDSKSSRKKPPRGRSPSATSPAAKRRKVTARAAGKKPVSKHVVELIGSDEEEDLTKADQLRKTTEAALADESAKASCIQTVTTCNKFVNPTPKQVHEWSKGKQVRRCFALVSPSQPPHRCCFASRWT